MFASANIDLDGLECYHAIHGLQSPPPGEPIYAVGLPRFLELLDGLRARGTLFVITRDVDGPVARETLTAAFGAGHELASHTHDHPYDFGKRGAVEVGEQLDRSSERIEKLCGQRPIGFRAPGYHVREVVLDALETRGYRYDSSVFPCFPYYAAKAAVMAAMRLLGRPSGSALTDPRALLAPLQPYRPRRGAFHHAAGRRARPLWEIPMCVLPGLRLPVIGTTLALMGPRWFSRIYPIVRTANPYLNLEFHGIDFLGPGDPGVTAELLARQPDLRLPVADKLRTFREITRRIADEYRLVTLAEMASRLDGWRTAAPTPWRRSA